MTHCIQHKRPLASCTECVHCLLESCNHMKVLKEAKK